MNHAILASVLGALLAACAATNPTPAPAPPPPPTPTDREPIAGQCAPTGCSGTVCAEAGSDIATTCEWHESYACYKDHGVCERGADTTCGWRASPELADCLRQKGAPAATSAATEACPAAAPKVGLPCTLASTPAGPFCDYPESKGARVCHCEMARWSCYDKPKDEPPAAAP
jgi:hypothetical protein